MTLSRQLRAATQALHTQAERAGLMPRLLRGLREVLDALPVAGQPTIVAEAQSAFGRHVALFEALA